MKDTPLPESIERTTVNQVELFVRCVGHGPEVIVLHGGPGAHHDYLLPQYDALAVGRRLRYYDQRGGGQSSVARTVDVGWRSHVQDLHALVQLWGSTPATILGYSWGGLLALLFAAQHPDLVARLALVSPASIWALGRDEFEERFAARMQAPEVIRAREELQRSGLRERDPDRYRRRAFELSVAAYFKVPTQAHGLTPFRVTARTQQAVWRSLGAYDLTGQLQAVDVPTLIIHGRHDLIPLASSEATARLLDARLEVFEHSGHVPHVEEFDRFVTVLDGFLPGAPPGTTDAL